MNGGLTFGVVLPDKCSVSKGDADTQLKQLREQDARLFSLGKTVGGNKSSFSAFLRNVSRGNQMPVRDKIHLTRTLYITPNKHCVRFLFVGLIPCPEEWWIPHYESLLSERCDLSPINS